MKRKFLTNLILLLFLNLLVKPFWVFGIDRKVQNIVGAGEYGFYFSLFSFSILLNILLDAGISNLNNRSVARDPAIQPAYFTRIVPLKFILAVVYALITIIAGVFIGYSAAQFKMLFVLVFNQFLLSFILYLRSNISGLHLFTTDSLLSVLDRLLLIIICSALIWGEHINKPFEIMWFVYAQTLAYLITTLVAFIILVRYSGILSFRFNLKFSLKLIRQSYPFAILILLMSFYSRIDLVMLERLLDDGKIQAGIYAQSFRILDAAAMFAFLFAGLLLPIFSRMIKLNEPVNEMVRLSFTILIIPAICLTLLSMQYSTEIIDLLYNEHITISATIFPLLMCTFIFVCVTYIFGTLLTAGGSLKEMNILALITVILNIILNLILIQKFKALGAAIASIISQGFFAVSQVLLTQRIFGMEINYFFITRLIIFALCLHLSLRLINFSGTGWIPGFFAGIFIAVILAWILRILTPGDIRKILISEAEIIL